MYTKRRKAIALVTDASYYWSHWANYLESQRGTKSSESWNHYKGTWGNACIRGGFRELYFIPKGQYSMETSILGCKFG
jgi:hypothetical protein